MTNEQVHAGEATLLDQSRQLGPKELERCSRHLLDVIAPEIAELNPAQWTSTRHPARLR